MDPITHGLVGLAAGNFSGSSGVLTNPMALACFIGSIIPDGDIIMQYRGDFSYLKNHRGASHSFLGAGILSVVIALLVHLLFPGSNYWKILMWTYIGCLTHICLDLFNSYGAKIFWPFFDKRIGNGLLLSIDPFLITTTFFVYWFNKTNMFYSGLSIGAFLIYLLFRLHRKINTSSFIMKVIDFPVKRLVLLPSMKGFFSWDFIAYGERKILTGKVSMICRKIVYRDRMVQTEDWIRNLVMKTEMGQFFQDFTKEYHISYEKTENGKGKAIMTDLRYYVNDRYMHHATVHFDNKFNPIEEIFHPYNMSRNIKVTV